MATYSAGTTYDGYKLRLDVSESNVNTGANTSVVDWKLYIVNGGRRFAINSFSYKVKINGSWVADYNGSCDTRDVGTTDAHYLTGGSITVSHENDGSKSVYCYAECNGRSNGNGPGWGACDGTFTLTKINRYANFTKHSINSTTEHTIKVDWNADVSCDAIQYKLNNGNWVATSGYPTYTITGLNPGITYTIKTRIKRTDSQLWTESGNISGTTKDCVVRNKINGTWKTCIPFLNVNGTWKKAIPYIKANGTWKEGIN